MHRAARIVTLSLVALATLGGCKKKKPEVAVTPVNNPPPAAARLRHPRRHPNATQPAWLPGIRKRSALPLPPLALRSRRRSTSTTTSLKSPRSRAPSWTRRRQFSRRTLASRIRIAGHTDSRGSDEYNLALGQRRAAAAKRYLTDRGIDGSRVEIVSFGEERGTCTEESDSCWSRNRRDEFEITGGDITAVQTSSR
jgi:peptidoglycan-associated lipoprotein